MLNMSALTRTYFDIQLNRLRSANDLFESTLTQEVKAIEKQYNEAIRALAEDSSDEERESLGEFFGDQAYEVRDVLPEVFRRSLFAAGYGAFENFMTLLARHFEKKGPGIELSDVKGRGIYSARVFLEKVAGVPFPHQTTEWSAISHYRRLRNAVIHADSRVQDDKGIKAASAFAKQEGTFDIDQYGQLSLHAGFNARFLDVVAAFADKLIDATRG